MINKEPNIPQSILRAIEEDNLAIFIGAGVSQVIGCWSWEKLAVALIEKCYEEKCINYRQKQILSNYNDCKKIITICRNLLKENGRLNDFYKIIDDCCKGDEEKKKKFNIYQELIRIPALYITTNFDKHFDEWFHADRIVSKDEGFKQDLLSNEKLYHIHGSIKNHKTLVLTVHEYFERYNPNNFQRFLKRIFLDKVILFVGYGMAEFEILDFLMTKAETERKKERFILLPYYKGHEDILAFDEYYFEEMGVTIVPYESDEKGYEQLYDVIKSWNGKIQHVSPYSYKKMKNIDEVVDSQW